MATRSASSSSVNISTASTSSTGSSSATRNNGNISVTTINCGDEMDLSTTTTSGDTVAGSSPSSMLPLELTTGTISKQQQQQQHYFNTTGGSIRITVPTTTPLRESDDDGDPERDEEDEEDVDPELSKIERVAVNMRPVNESKSDVDKNVPRPMSWEGELSEHEESTLLERIKEGQQAEGPNEIGDMDVDSSSGLVGDSAKVTNQGTRVPLTHFSEAPSPHEVQPIKKEKTELITVKPEFLERNMLHAKAATAAAAAATAAKSNNLTANGPGTNKFEVVNLKYEQDLGMGTPPPPTSSGPHHGPHHHNHNRNNSPLLVRSKSNLLPTNPSPDSAIHSVYTHSSPSQSPLTSRHHIYTPSLSRNNSDASHSSCYSYSSEFSPTHSPVQGRHLNGSSNSGAGSMGGMLYQSQQQGQQHPLLYRPLMEGVSLNANNGNVISSPVPGQMSMDNGSSVNSGHEQMLMDNDQLQTSAAGISRQQLINSPCPICGDKISGFHYGIFSCESCKGFFKRTVQNRKNYVCVRGAACPVTIATRKKCPACRFEKCLQRGMKLEAIREDRTRGGRSTYQCSFTLPGSMLSPESTSSSTSSASYYQNYRLSSAGQNGITGSGASGTGGSGAGNHSSSGINSAVNHSTSSHGMGDNGTLAGLSTIKKEEHAVPIAIPQLLQEIMDVEHLWQLTEAELSRLNQPPAPGHNHNNTAANLAANPLLASAGLENGSANPDLIANLCNIADHRLYKIVKWCKSLPLFKHISIDDQICLLINSWCELLLFSCCYRSVGSPGEIRISLGKVITLAQAKSSGFQTCIERMLNLTDHLRRLRVDRYEYVAMKVIVLLQSDTSELKEPEKVRTSQEKALQALQSYTIAHYPESPAKFGELLLRIPELQRTCQVGKEMLTIRQNGEEFNLLMELLRGEH